MIWEYIKKKHKLEKKSLKANKKFPELKMMANGDYKSSNHTMSSDDEVFNVSKQLSIPYYMKFDIVPTHKKVYKDLATGLERSQ